MKNQGSFPLKCVCVSTRLHLVEGLMLELVLAVSEGAF